MGAPMLRVDTHSHVYICNPESGLRNSCTGLGVPIVNTHTHTHTHTPYVHVHVHCHIKTYMFFSRVQALASGSMGA